MRSLLQMPNIGSLAQRLRFLKPDRRRRTVLSSSIRSRARSMSPPRIARFILVRLIAASMPNCRWRHEWIGLSPQRPTKYAIAIWS